MVKLHSVLSIKNVFIEVVQLWQLWNVLQLLILEFFFSKLSKIFNCVVAQKTEFCKRHITWQLACTKN